MKIFSFLHKPCRKFIDIIVNGIPILPYQNHPVPALSVQTIDDYTVCHILMSFQFQFFHIFRSGSHIIYHRRLMNTGGMELIQIQIRQICQLSHIMYNPHFSLNLLLKSLVPVYRSAIQSLTQSHT